jgi:ABC-type sugar transport system ATPase subunit
MTIVAMEAGRQPKTFLRLTNITKTFGGIHALENVNLEVRRGEVLAILGDNGAGKTTLVKIISGVHHASSGEIECNGVMQTIGSPRRAHEMGIETVFQDLALIPNLAVADNFFIGREIVYDLVPGFIRIMRKRAMEKETAESLRMLDIHIPSLKASVDTLSGGQRQAIAIARAVHWKANLVILDEPTAALSVPEQNKVLELARRLANQNVAVVYITHNMNDVVAVTDRIVVLYRGRIAGELETRHTTKHDIVDLIMSGGAAALSVAVH